MTLWVALVVLVVFSAFFSASETAFSSLNQIRLKSRAEDGDTSAEMCIRDRSRSAARPARLLRLTA